MTINITLAEHERFETARLLLRKIEMTDAADIFEYASDPETVQYVSFQPHENLERTKTGIAEFFMPRRLTSWGIVEKSSGKFIGTIDFRIEADRMAEFGWILNKNYWGRGYMPEAAAVLVKFCFEELGLQVLTAKHSVANPKSGRVMEKLGMKRLGQVYSCFDKFEKPVLDDYWALTKDDYDKLTNS